MDIAAWLHELGLSQYDRAFSENDIDTEVLIELTADDLVGLGVTSIGHRRKLLASIARLKEAAQVPPDAGLEAGRSDPSELLPAKSHDAERRQLTVMFVDLVGSTALSGRLDPEDMRTIITTYQNTVAGIVTRFDGHVAKYMGDGILCYFGWPNAHEEDAERAVRAALSILPAVKALKSSGESTLLARIGIGTGLVVVGDLIGVGAAQEEAVVGDTPNLAARLQALAAPDQAVISMATRRLLGDVFDVVDLGAQELRGFDSKTAAFVIIKERTAESRFDGRTAGSVSAMVGRDHELALMLERWKQAKLSEGQLVLLSGEAGIGKSRVTRAMIDSAAEGPHIRLSYQCSPYHSDSPLYPAIQQLTFAAGITADDSVDDKLDRLEKILIGDETHRPLFASLLGLPYEARYGKLDLTPQKHRAQTLHALVAQLVGLSFSKPVLFVIEDAHWIDATTLELIDLCLDPVANSRVMMLITARPTFQHAFGGHPIVTKLALNRLGREHVAAIVARITKGKMLPAELNDAIAAKTDGMPLFVEEFTKTLLESGELKETASAYELKRPINQLTIPSTLYDSLMARLDRLQPVKEVAQTAACIGRDFEYRLLKAVSPLNDMELRDSLERLLKAELIFQRGVPPESTYIFKHALVRDAAYDNLLKTRRRTIHGKLVTALEAKAAAPELLAYHSAMAGLIEKAVRYWLKAGENAAARSANKEAAGHLKAGIDLLDRLPDTAEKSRFDLDLHSALASVLMVTQGYGSEEVGKVSNRAVDLCRQVGDQIELVAVLWQAWLFNYTRANHEKASEIANEILKRAEQAVDPAARIVAHVPLGLSLFAIGKPLESQRHLDQAVQTYNELKGGPVAYRYGMEVGAVAYAYQAWALGLLGYPEQSLKGRDVVFGILERVNHPFTLARGLNWCSILSAINGDWSNAYKFGDHAVRAASDHGLQMAGSLGMVIRSVARAFLEPEHSAIDEIANSLETYRRTGALIQVPFLLTLFGEACLKHRAWQLGLGAMEEALQLALDHGEHQVTPEIYRIQAGLLSGAKIEDGEPYYLKSIELARSQQTRTFELRAAADLAELWMDQGKWVGAHKLLAPVYERFTEGFGMPYLGEAAALLRRLDQNPPSSINAE